MAMTEKEIREWFRDNFPNAYQWQRDAAAKMAKGDGFIFSGHRRYGLNVTVNMAEAFRELA